MLDALALDLDAPTLIAIVDDGIARNLIPARLESYLPIIQWFFRGINLGYNEKHTKYLFQIYTPSTINLDHRFGFARSHVAIDRDIPYSIDAFRFHPNKRLDDRFYQNC